MKLRITLELARPAVLVLMAMLIVVSGQTVLAQEDEFPPLPENPDRVQGSNQAFGIAYDKAATDEVTFSFSLSETEPTLFSFDSTVVMRDIRLSFFTKHGTNANHLNRTLVTVNGVQRIATELYSSGSERAYEFILNRNFFTTGTNTVVFEPRNTTGDKPWGIRNVSFDYIEPIAISLGQLDSETYGYNENPTRFTGLRVNFVLSDLDASYALDVTGWDIDQSNESQVFLNGASIGFLTAAPNTTNAGDSLLLPSQNIVSGINEIEFVQRFPDINFSGASFEQWAVSDLLVKTVSADLTVSELRLSKEMITPNRPVEVEVDVANLGEIASTGGQLIFLLSEDEVINLNDTEIVTTSVAALAADEQTTLNQSVTFEREALGLYLGVCVDGGGDANVENNCFLGPLLETGVNVAPYMLLLNDS